MGGGKEGRSTIMGEGGLLFINGEKKYLLHENFYKYKFRLLIR